MPPPPAAPPPPPPSSHPRPQSSPSSLSLSGDEFSRKLVDHLVKEVKKEKEENIEKEGKVERTKPPKERDPKGLRRIEISPLKKEKEIPLLAKEKEKEKEIEKEEEIEKENEKEKKVAPPSPQSPSSTSTYFATVPSASLSSSSSSSSTSSFTNTSPSLSSSASLSLPSHRANGLADLWDEIERSSMERENVVEVKTLFSFHSPLLGIFCGVDGLKRVLFLFLPPPPLSPPSPLILFCYVRPSPYFLLGSSEIFIFSLEFVTDTSACHR